MRVVENNKNKLGFSAFYYNKKQMAEMPKQFQSSFKQALPYIKKQTAASKTILKIRTFSENSKYKAWFETTVTKKIRSWYLNDNITGLDYKTRLIDYIDVEKTTPEKIKECLKASKRTAREDLKRQIDRIAENGYKTPENRNKKRLFRAKIRRIINKITFNRYCEATRRSS